MKPIFRVTDFGAVPNTEALQTATFQAALSAGIRSCYSGVAETVGEF